MTNDCFWARDWLGYDLLWHYFENNGDKTFNWEIEFPSLQNMTIPDQPNKKDDKTIKISVPPGEKTYAFLKRLSLIHI